MARGMRIAKLYLLLLTGLMASEAWANDEGMVQGIFQKESIRSEERLAQSKNLYETGLSLYRQQQYERARDYFRKALSLNPDDQDARNYLIRVQSVLGVKRATVGNQSEWLEKNLVVKRQEQWVELRKRLGKADMAFKTFSSNDHNVGFRLPEDDEVSFIYQRLRDAEEVKEFYEAALKVAKIMDPGEDQRKAQAKIFSKIEAMDEWILAIRAQVESQKRVESKSRLIEERENNEIYLRNKIKNLIESAKSYLKREEFEQCIKLCEDVLTVDRKNKKAELLIKKAIEMRHKKVVNDTKFDRKKELTRRLLKIKESFVPYSSSIVYPDDWDQVNSRQAKELADNGTPAWERRLDAALDRYVSYSCPPGLPLTEVLSQLSGLSGLNIVLSPRVLQERDEEELELNEFTFENMKLRYILQWVVRKVDLAFVLKFDVIYITENSVTSDQLQVQIYDVQDLLQTKKTFTAPKLEDGFNADEEAGLDIEGVDILDDEPLSGDVLQEMIQQSIPGNWEDGEGVMIRTLETGALMIKNTNEVHLQVAELIGTLRKTSALQIEVEARSLNISKGFLREIGVDWSGLDAARLNAGVTPGFYDRSSESYTLQAAIVNGLTSSTPNVGMFIEHSILGAFQAKVMIQALEQHDDVTQLIAPKLVLVNNNLGYIRLGRTQNIISDYESGEADGGDDNNNDNSNFRLLRPVITAIDEGQLLSVTATVSSDRKYITLRLNPDFQEVTIPPDRVQNIQGSSVSAPVELPVVTKQKLRTTAVIPDDGVLIMGGVSTSSEENGTRGVPIISRIPLFGRLFRSDSRTDSSSDSMFMIHGKIIVFDELEAGL
jgi:general secretion pathway protein D